MNYGVLKSTSPCFLRNKSTNFNKNEKNKLHLANIIHQNDHDLEDKVNETNRKLENLCEGKGMIFINDSNIYSTCLNRRKLNLNKSGTFLLNFFKILNENVK